MRCSGLHCGGCKSAGGASRLLLMVGAGAVGLLVLYRVAGSALAGVSASVADANRAVGAAVAVVLVVAAVTAGGWLLLARRRQVREEPAVTDFAAQVQAALDARDRASSLRLTSNATPTPIERVTAYRLDAGPRPPEVRS